MNGKLGEDVLNFSVLKTEDGSFRIKMSLKDNYLYANTESIESGKRTVENAIEKYIKEGINDPSSNDPFKQIYYYISGIRL